MTTPPGPASPPVVRTRGLGWRVGGFTIVEGVDLDVREGEFLSIIGPNGAGKSTLLNLLSGTTRPTAGTVELLGEDVTRRRAPQRARRGLGRTFQTSSLFPRLTVADNALVAAMGGAGSLTVWRRPPRRGATAARALEALEVVGLAHRRAARAADLSYGDKRRLEIALALCGRPGVLLLDEPTAGVSMENVEELVDVVREVHRRGTTVLMVEHHMEVVTSVSDRIAVMHRGSLLLLDVPEVVMADETVRRAYLGEELAPS